MITTGDIIDILCNVCSAFGIVTYKEGGVPGTLAGEYIVIYPEEMTSDPYWKKELVEIRIVVPDREGQAAFARLTELEHQAALLFENGFGEYDGAVYRYATDSLTRIADAALGNHYINVRVLFKVLNVN